MLQEVSHIGFPLPVSHVCLQIAFPVSHIGFTISSNFYNFNVKGNWRLICSWITATLKWYIGSYTLLPIDFNGKLEIFLKHLKKKKIFCVCACVCDWTLIIFQEGLGLILTSSHVNFVFFLKKNFFVWTSTQITLKFFHVNMCQPCWILKFFFC